MSETLDAAERNWKNGDTRSFDYLLLEEVKRLSKESADLRAELVKHLEAHALATESFPA